MHQKSYENDKTTRQYRARLNFVAMHNTQPARWINEARVRGSLLRNEIFGNIAIFRF